jgi:hypothetical protein
MKTRGLIILFVTSVFLAVINAAPLDSWPLQVPIGATVGFYFDLIFCIAGIWLLLVVIALKVYGKRGLWLLIGMPLALFRPIFWTLVKLGWIQFVI